nr:putative wax ester synthase/acyl-CoA:diacylglycerol acyltransferase [uncultured bacterium]
MHVSALMIVDPSECEEGWSFDRFRDLLVSRMPEVPQLRWRYVDVPLGLDRPYWVEATDIDPDFHCRRIGLPQPGGEKELGEVIGRIVSYKLNRDRPLWEAWVIEGLENGKVAILQKMHHAIIDGVSGAGLAEVLLDLEATPRPPSGEQREHLGDPEIPSQAELLVRGVVNTAFKTPFRTARFVRQTVQQLVSAAPVLQGDSKVDLPMTAPRSVFNEDPTPRRSFASARLSLDEVKTLKNAYGVKLNDVVLGLCSAALRHYMEHVGDVPDQSLLAQCPVSLRVEGKEGEIGNKVGSMFSTLATDVDDPAERLAVIHESTQGAKEMREAMAAHQIMGLTETTPPGLINLAARMYTRGPLKTMAPPAVNVVISNVPGPPFPLFVAGCKLDAMYPMGPLLMGMALNITVISYCDHLDFGFMVCPDFIPEPEVIAEGVYLGLKELVDAAPKG